MRLNNELVDFQAVLLLLHVASVVRDLDRPRFHESNLAHLSSLLNQGRLKLTQLSKIVDQLTESCDYHKASVLRINHAWKVGRQCRSDYKSSRGRSKPSSVT
jgi:hypothetical protein